MQRLLLLLAVAGCSASDQLAGPECSGSTPYTIGASATGTVSSKQCQGPNGNTGYLYTLSLAAPTNVQFILAPSGFRGGLALYPGKVSTGSVTAAALADGDGTFSVKAFLPAGDYFLLVSECCGGGGPYTITSQPGAVVTDCTAGAWALPGVSITGTIASADCAGSGIARQDIYQVNMKAGQTVTVTGQLSKGGAVLWRTGDGTTPDVITRSLPNGGTTTFSFTAPVAQAYRVHMISDQYPSGVVNYTVSIQ